MSRQMARGGRLRYQFRRMQGATNDGVTVAQRCHAFDGWVMRRVGAARLRRWKVVGESPAFHVQPYLGQVAQFPLTTSLPVLPGDVVALTTPTWAPVLSISLNSKKFAWRQSRSTACGIPSAASVQSPGQTATYGCNYPGTRVEYSATEVTNPVSVNPIHGPIRRSARRTLAQHIN